MIGGATLFCCTLVGKERLDWNFNKMKIGSCKHAKCNNSYTKYCSRVKKKNIAHQFEQQLFCHWSASECSIYAGLWVEQPGPRAEILFCEASYLLVCRYFNQMGPRGCFSHNEMGGEEKVSLFWVLFFCCLWTFLWKRENALHIFFCH